MKTVSEWSPPLKTTNKTKTLKLKRFDKHAISNESIKKLFKMQCDNCDNAFETFSEAKLHYRRVHRQAGYLICCEKKFMKFGLVLQHCQWHIDPNTFR